MNCPNCNAEIPNDSSLRCDRCGSGLQIRRPRAELVPPIQTTPRKRSPGIFEFKEFETIDTQWSKLEKFSPARAALSRISHYFTGRAATEPSPARPARASSNSAQKPADARPSSNPAYLVVNHAEIVKTNCACCGEVLAATLPGEKLLVADVIGARPLPFCVNCGDNIVSHARDEATSKHYSWDWAIPLLSSASK